MALISYLCSEDVVVWLWHLSLYICLTISSCYGSILLTLELIRKDGGLSTLCHRWVFACQQREYFGSCLYQYVHDFKFKSYFCGIWVLCMSCVVSNQFLLCSLLDFLSNLWFIGTSNVWNVMSPSPRNAMRPLANW